MIRVPTQTSKEPPSNTKDQYSHRFRPTRKVRGFYKNKGYTTQDIAKVTRLAEKTVKMRLKLGWTVAEIIENPIKQTRLSKVRLKKLRPYPKKLSRCKTCGIEYYGKGPQRYCDKICREQYNKHPEEFGLWWKT